MTVLQNSIINAELAAGELLNRCPRKVVHLKEGWPNYSWRKFHAYPSKLKCPKLKRSPYILKYVTQGKYVLRTYFKKSNIRKSKKFMTNNIRSTYNCHTFWRLQVKSIKPNHI